jgi:lysophospholipase L1-like esterase
VSDSEDPAPRTAPSGPLLLLGDSLTEGGPWQEAFAEVDVVNAGRAGDTTADIAERLEDVVAAGPATVVVMAGTNESRKATVEQVVRGLEDILFQLRHELPEARLLVCSVLPRERERADWIRDVNIHVRQFAPTVKAEFVDLWPVFAEEDGELRADLTTDRLHLTDAGYAAWVQELRGVLG